MLPDAVRQVETFETPDCLEDTEIRGGVEALLVLILCFPVKGCLRLVTCDDHAVMSAARSGLDSLLLVWP